MEYKKVIFHLDDAADYQQDLLVAELGDLGFDTFEDTDTGFDAFIIAANLDLSALADVVNAYSDQIKISYEVLDIKTENWNEEWEKNFSPLIISDHCYVRATFHEAQPQYAYEIVIDPKMAFGTGHHQTTTMMMNYILETDMSGKSVLDMGAGTGILAILAAKRGAAELVAIDNDDVCYQSAIENAALNGVDSLTSLCGSKEAIPNREFDVILANINRNILVDQMENYAHALKNDGLIFFSGFYEETDLAIIKAEAARFNLQYVDHKSLQNWAAAQFVRIR